MEAVPVPFNEVAAFGPQGPIDVKAFNRGELGYSQTRGAASGSNEVGTSASGGVTSTGGGGGSSNLGAIEAAIQELATIVEQLGAAVDQLSQGITEIQDRLNNASAIAECDGDGNVVIQISI